MTHGSNVVYSDPVTRVPNGTWDNTSISACAMAVPERWDAECSPILLRPVATTPPASSRRTAPTPAEPSVQDSHA